MLGCIDPLHPALPPSAACRLPPPHLCIQVPESPLLQLHWWRMILDEAQMVGSGMSQVRYAVGAMPCAVLNIARIQGHPRHSAAAPPPSPHSQVSSLLPCPPLPTRTAICCCPSSTFPLTGHPTPPLHRPPLPIHSQVAVMASRLSTTHRWCVTGTPIGEGQLEDIAGLLRTLGWVRQRGATSVMSRPIAVLHAILRHSGLHVLHCPGGLSF